MLFKDKDIVYGVPVRYGDFPLPPIPVWRIVGDQQASDPDQPHLYVYGFAYGHEVWVTLPVFYSWKRAQRYATLLYEQHLLARRDEAHALVQRHAGDWKGLLGALIRDAEAHSLS